ncbi:MAG TPA: NAD(P)-dependent oxidoreductase [bacterium]|nr:NAD(P)-dependent oxidoreductase [bacterium]
MQKRLLVVAPSEAERWLTDEGLRVLAGAGTVHRLDLPALAGETEREEAFDRALPEADALLVAPWGRQGLPVFTPERWEKAKALAVIAGTFDHRFAAWLDVAEAQRRGVAVIDTSGAMSLTVAEFALTMILSLLRDVPDTVAEVRRGGWPHGWQDLPGFVFGDLTGRHVGLAGLGVIGRRLTELLGPFRCVVSAYDPFVPADVMGRLGVRRVESMRDLAAGSEILVVAIPKTPATEGIVSREVIDALPRGALFVLVGRMWTVEQEALWRRAAAGEIRAAIDVFLPEPPPADHLARTNRHVLPTPHLAGNTVQANRRCFTAACAEAIAALEGRALQYAVRPEHAAVYAGTAAEPIASTRGAAQGRQR